MDRSRDGRRASSIVGSNGFNNRRKHRTNSLRDSPDEDAGVELQQESIKLRDRVKKDRDREMNRERERERGRDLRERGERDLRERRSSSNNKRRKAERLMTSRDEIATSDESEDDLDDEYEDTITNTSAAGSRLLPTANHHHHQQSHLTNHHHHNNNHSEQQHISSNSTITGNHNHNNNTSNLNHHSNLQHRKSFPPISSSSSTSKQMYRPVPPVWKPGDEMIGVSVPRKARSASTKRLHDLASNSSHNSGGGGGVAGGEQILRQASNSPVGQSGGVSTPSPAPPMSPSSSNASTKKKLKPLSGNVNNGPKQKPPKVMQKPGSSNPEDLEIEIAEVLFGLKTSSSSKKEDSKEANHNRSIGDSKTNAGSPANNPLSAVAPKRKRPRQVLDNSSFAVARSSPISAKPELDQTPISSPNLDRISGSNAHEMGGNSVSLRDSSPAEPESVKDSELKPEESMKETRNLVVAKEEMVSLPKGEELSPASRPQESNRVDSSSMATDSVSAATEIRENNPVECETETLRQEKFQIDLMAPPPQGRSSPGRDVGMVPAVVDEKPVLDTEMKPVSLKERENGNGKRWNDEPVNAAAPEVKRGKVAGKETETEEFQNKVRSFDLKLDLSNGVKDGASGVDALAGNKAVKVPPSKEEPTTEKSGQSTNSLPLPMSMPSWPGGLAPPMGYMAPFQGVVPMDGTAVTPSSQPFGQPRPKRCATHCYIARSINLLQQLTKMNPFWPPAAAAGSTALFGSKPGGLNVMPTAADLQSIAARGAHNVLEKMPNAVNIPSHAGGKDKSSQSANTQESAHRKQHQQQQILIQPSMPSMPPNNLMAPAFIFPLNQHQAAIAAASARPSAGKAASGGSTAASSNIPGSAAANAAAAGGASAAMGFNFPTNMQQPANETQYLAILQNSGAYPFPMAPVGAPSNYRGTPGQAMPLFNGSFYPSQMIHPSQIQTKQPPSTQSHQNASVSGSSSSQKHLHNHQQRSHQNVQNFTPQKLQHSQQVQQPSQNQRPKHSEGEGGSEDSPSDNRGVLASMSIYGQNFSMPIHPQNFALMTPPSGLANAAPNAGSNQSEKKSQQSQQHGVKTSMDSLPPHSFAMSFGSMNGAIPGPGIDITSMAQNQAFFQTFPEAARQNMQMMAAAQSAQKKNFRMSEDNKSSGGNDSSNNDDERKNLAAKSQSIAFSRSELSEAAIQSGSVLESSTRSLNATSGLSRSSQAMNSNVPSAHIQNQLQSQLQQQQYLMLRQQQQQQQQQHQHQQQQHQQQQQMQQQQMQQQQAAGAVAAANSRNKASNGNLYADHLNSSPTMAAKFPNALSGFPQNLVQSNSSSPGQSPQWKSSTRTAQTSQAPPSVASSTTSSQKNLPQQQQHNSQMRPQMHTQISFGGNQKRSTNSPGHQTVASNHQVVGSPTNSPMIVGSPTNSSISKGAGGSPRTTTSASTSNKMGQASALSAPQPQNSQGQKSMSILGNPHTASSLGGGAKPQSQQHLTKNAQQAHLFFSYTQAQSPHSTSANSGPGGYFMQQPPQQQRRRSDQQQPPGGPGTTSNGILSMCSPATLGAATNDPAKAIAAATSNQKGGGLPSQGIMHAAQFSAQALPAGYSYINPVPAAVQVKPAEQRQPAGQPEKK